MLLYRSPGLAQEWRLVTVRGRIDAVNKLGDRWRAELRRREGAGGRARSGRRRDPGDVGARGPSRDGRRHRPPAVPDRDGPALRDPAARPQRPSRGRARRDGPGGRRRRGHGTRARAADRARLGRPAAGASAPPTGAAPAVPDADLVDLASLDGGTVRVGGIVGDLLPDGFLLDDGTAIGPVILHGQAAELLPLIEPGDAVNVTGRVDSTERGWTVVADDPAGVVLAGDPTAAARPPRAATPEPRRRRAPAAPVSPTTAGFGPFAGHDLTGIAGLGTLASPDPAVAAGDHGPPAASSGAACRASWRPDWRPSRALGRPAPGPPGVPRSG